MRCNLGVLPFLELGSALSLNVCSSRIGVELVILGLFSPPCFIRDGSKSPICSLYRRITFLRLKGILLHTLQPSSPSPVSFPSEKKKRHSLVHLPASHGVIMHSPRLFFIFSFLLPIGGCRGTANFILDTPFLPQWIGLQIGRPSLAIIPNSTRPLRPSEQTVLRIRTLLCSLFPQKFQAPPCAQSTFLVMLSPVTFCLPPLLPFLETRGAYLFGFNHTHDPLSPIPSTLFFFLGDEFRWWVALFCPNTLSINFVLLRSFPLFGLSETPWETEWL